MDAYAYLIRHGWSGPGNPLNPDRAGVKGGLGLTKPLLVARRSGNSGVGKTTTKDPTNQWWLRGFEDALKGFGTGPPAPEMGVVGKGNALTSELYRHFVRGEVVPGTLGGVDKKKEVKGDKEGSKKRKRGDGEGETKEEKRVRREEKKKRKAEKVEKRERRREKREMKEKRAVEKAEKKKAKAEKGDKKQKPEDDYPTPVSMDLDPTDAQDSGASLDTSKLDKLKKKEKKDKKNKSSKESKKSKKESSSDDSSKRKSKKSKTA